MSTTVTRTDDGIGTAEGLDRLVTFLDAVVAIAVTLLVLPLVDAANGARTAEGLSHFLRDNAALGYTFVLSFVVITRLWRAHHHLFEHVGRYDGFLMVASLGWALTIVVLPFPTRLIAVYGTDRSVAGLYTGVLALSSALLTAMTLHVARRAPLRRGAQATATLLEPSAVASTAGFVLAFVLAATVSGVGYYGLLLLFAAGPAGRLWTRSRAHPSAR